MIKSILFDFYGLFLPDAYDAWLQSNGQQRAGVFADIMQQSNQGEITESQFLEELSTAIGRPVATGEIHAAGTVVDSELVELARELKSHYSVNLLSNASTRLRAKLENLSLDSLFDTIIISSEIGHAKPSSEAFRIATEQLAVPASDILFIDDKMANIEAARKNGLQSIHYTGVPALRRELQSQNLI